MAGSELERLAFGSLKDIFIALQQGKDGDSITIDKFLALFCEIIDTTMEMVAKLDLVVVWEKLIDIITVVIPPIRNLFSGIPPNAPNRYHWSLSNPIILKACFQDGRQSLEDVLRLYFCGNSDDEDKVEIKKTPEILVVSVESDLIPHSWKNIDFRTNDRSHLGTPKVISFPESFDLRQYAKIENPIKDEDMSQIQYNYSSSDYQKLSIYDLVSVASVNEDSICCKLKLLLSLLEFVESQDKPWGSWFISDTLNALHIAEPSFNIRSANYTCQVSSESMDWIPRLLVYVRRDVPDILSSFTHLVTRAGQYRLLGDQALVLASRPEKLIEARKYYEEAISLDESLRDTLQENMEVIDRIERAQYAKIAEENGDLCLSANRLNDACDYYRDGVQHAIPGTQIFERLREKLTSLVDLLSLETAVVSAELGEKALRDLKYVEGKQYFVEALTNLPECVHLHTILVWIDKTVQTVTAVNKMDEAHAALRAGKYRLAHELFTEAMVLVPDKAHSLRLIVEDFDALLQCEDALVRQRAGLVAMDEKRYSTAVSLLTEALQMLPEERVTDRAAVLVNRSFAYQELGELENALRSCEDAIAIKSNFAVAYFSRGVILISMMRFDEAVKSLEAAEALDNSYHDDVKVKIRQINTAREVHARKEREVERERQREEEKRLLQEKKAREEQAKRERAEKAALEQAENRERGKMKEEDRLIKALREAEIKQAKLREKEEEKARTKAAKTLEKEKQKLEKKKQKEMEKQTRCSKKEEESEGNINDESDVDNMGAINTYGSSSTETSIESKASHMSVPSTTPSADINRSNNSKIIASAKSTAISKDPAKISSLTSNNSTGKDTRTVATYRISAESETKANAALASTNATKSVKSVTSIKESTNNTSSDTNSKKSLVENKALSVSKKAAKNVSNAEIVKFSTETTATTTSTKPLHTAMPSTLNDTVHDCSAPVEDTTLESNLDIDPIDFVLDAIRGNQQDELYNGLIDSISGLQSNTMSPFGSSSPFGNDVLSESYPSTLTMGNSMGLGFGLSLNTLDSINHGMGNLLDLALSSSFEHDFKIGDAMDNNFGGVDNIYNRDNSSNYNNCNIGVTSNMSRQLNNNDDTSREVNISSHFASFQWLNNLGCRLLGRLNDPFRFRLGFPVDTTVLFVDHRVVSEWALLLQQRFRATLLQYVPGQHSVLISFNDMESSMVYSALATLIDIATSYYTVANQATINSTPTSAFPSLYFVPSSVINGFSGTGLDASSPSWTPPLSGMGGTQSFR